MILKDVRVVAVRTQINALNTSGIWLDHSSGDVKSGGRAELSVNDQIYRVATLVRRGSETILAAIVSVPGLDPNQNHEVVSVSSDAIRRNSTFVDQLRRELSSRYGYVIPTADGIGSDVLCFNPNDLITPRRDFCDHPM